MLVYAYIRVSTEEQAEKGNSLSEQRERLTAFCKVMDWDDPIWYVDDGYSAKDTRRPEINRLLEDVKNSNKEGVIVTTKLDRLSRNLYDILSLSRFFEKYKCKYVSATESFDTSTAAGRLTLQVLGMVAEFERERNSERVRDNMVSLAAKLEDFKAISRPCFGYDIIEGLYVPNLEEKMIVQKMADQAEAGIGPRNIAKWLNKEAKVFTKEGNLWHGKVVRELLLRETLIGDFVYNKTFRVGSKVYKRPEEEWTRIPNHHEPILDREQQAKIRIIFDGRKTVGRHVSDDTYLLSGLVRCSHCNSKMNGKLNRSFSKKLNQENLRYTYTCDGYIKKGICFHHHVSRDELENLVIQRIHEVANSAPGTIQISVAKPKTATLEKETISAKLEKLDRKLQKQIEAYEDELISREDLKKAKQRVEDERKRLLEALKEIEEGYSSSDHVKVQENAKQCLSDISPMDRFKTKQAIRQVIDHIEIKNGEAVKIVWALSKSNLSLVVS
ncbi:recombinase family protein [Paenibacillus elgii]|uniref:recombinase family protein n=1 Tax=Paenibacillus elgii TaxID=189691 RepID=UPI002040A303|nr:recombinase family protein [Paenibacillus elgii]MCM3273693.1 recombinase family protein [Paenibacillus elgii]